MSAPTYELIAEYQAIDSRLDELALDGLLDEGSTLENHLTAMLDATEAQIEQKFENILRYERNLAIEEEAIEAEIARLKARRDTAKNKRSGLRSYLHACMKQLGEKKIKTPIASATRRPGVERIEVDEAQAWNWPEEVFNACCKQTLTVSKTALKEFKDRFEELKLPGVAVVTGDESLMIR